MNSDSTILLAQVPGGCAGGYTQLIPILLMVAVFYFLMMRPAQKRERERKEMLAAIKKGDLVVTSGGLLGKVSGLSDQIVTIEVAEKIRLRVMRSHIAGKQGTEIAAPAEPAS
ncbi:MAG: preprotein translocase subunit YajC [Myxococcota bacterium]